MCELRETQVLQFALDYKTAFTHWKTKYSTNTMFKTLPGVPTVLSTKESGSLINQKNSKGVPQAATGGEDDQMWAKESIRTKSTGWTISKMSR